MQEENYLNRLKAIREKYNAQGNYEYTPKHAEVLYPLSQKI
jgi:hypothetical protein